MAQQQSSKDWNFSDPGFPRIGTFLLNTETLKTIGDLKTFEDLKVLFSFDRVHVVL
jgi:hypothetical protein